MPPAMGAWMISRTMNYPLMKEDTIKVPMIEAPMPMTIDVGVLYRLKRLKLLSTSISYPKKGNSARMTKLPMRAYETLKGEAWLKVCASVEQPYVLLSLIIKMTPKASPIKPPKVKIE